MPAPIRLSIFNQYLAARPSRPLPNQPWFGAYPQATSDWALWLLHLVIIGALGSSVPFQLVAALQQPHRSSLRRPACRFSAPFVGLIVLLRPVTCSLEFEPQPNTFSLPVFTTGSVGREGHIWYALLAAIMSPGAQDDSPSQQPAADRAGRRNSLGRALERFRTVFSRRGSSKAEPATESETPITRPTLSGAAVEHAGVAPAASAASPSEPTVALEAELEVDDDAADDFDDTEEPIIPVDASTRRPGISEEKARILFEKYGLRYPAVKRAQQQEPPSKIRRVEKPVRIRLHWSCHHCKTAFAHDKVCSSCGHGRCGDCNRSPPQRVLRILEKTKREKEAAEIRERAASASPEEDVVSGPSSTMLAERVPVELQPETPAALLPHAEAQKPETEPLRFIYTIRSGSLEGAAGLELYHMSHFNRDLPKPGIQRVFKQPRQRVRWNCHQCEAVFTNRDMCSNCQHEKCGNCTRTP